MQNFENYLKDIHFAENPELLDDDIADDFDDWIGERDVDTLMLYADDYAKDCIRLDHERIVKGIKKGMEENHFEDGDRYDWCYEECIEVVNDQK